MNPWQLVGVVSPLLAHQGGWDEILMIVGPLAVVGGALWLANKRAAELEAAEAATETASADTATADDG
ncbi:MAG: hypothetical protein AAF962_01910 [Actinomycetota bacterium]